MPLRVQRGAWERHAPIRATPRRATKRYLVVVAIFGGAGVGKSTLAHGVADALGLPATGPDEFRPGALDVVWRRLLASLTSDHVVESMIAPAAYRRFLDEHNALLVGVECDQKVQARRLHRRGWEQRSVRAELFYRFPVEPDMIIRGDMPVRDSVALVLSQLGASVPRNATWW